MGFAYREAGRRVDPGARLTILLMINQLPNATDIRTTFPTAVYSALMEP